MDPNATLRLIADCFRLDDHEHTDDHCQALADWRANGGFEPDWTLHPLATGSFVCRLRSTHDNAHPDWMVHAR